MYRFEKIGINEKEKIKELFVSVFTDAPWNDDWSNQKQLDLYIYDLVGQSNSLTYGLFNDRELIAVSMGHVKHWYTGTEYCIDEFCVRSDRQRNGVGTYFIAKIEADIKEKGLKQIFLQTENNVPAFDFYRKTGFNELKNHVSFAKEIF